MGASQSSDSNTSSSTTTQKTSYYELLGITRQATEVEIKKAYRRKALLLHPDRNHGNEEAATKTFAEVQAAYEVLSDPQERAWYDSHETAILRGDDDIGGDASAGAAPSFGSVRATTADDLARLVRKFNSNVEFSDAPSGFFGFIRETFDQLAKEEEVAADWEGGEYREYPTFGHRDDDYGDVVKAFYAAWAGFATVKSFSWVDKYRLSEAPDRFIRRRMEEENGKLRKAAKQEFNDAVRSLVAFVRKRDPRYVPNTQTEEERQKVLRDAAQAQAARARAANAAKMEDEVPEWTKVREPEELEESEEEEVEEHVLECVACNKIFKSERQWEAHEKSKKHQKAVRALQHKMRKENAHLDLDGSDGESGGIDTPEVDVDEEEMLGDVVDEWKDHEARADGASHGNSDTLDDAELDTDAHTDTRTDANNTSTSDAKDLETQTTNDTRTNQSKEAETKAPTPPSPSDSENDDYASLETVQARLVSMSLDTPTTGASENGDDSTGPSKKLGKAAQKRAKKAAAAASGATADTGHNCEVCREYFPSRTQLFKHVEAEGHAALKSVVGGGGGGKGKKKGRK
ncbi:DnaJ-domain-containing protein [Zymoseptoria brevis]|uniref:DnaJ-domain-containing protein n=1 Tax=Zymoseptoria brevis TaxID=1047168 RepID=A0A0F4GSB0_9PEZI|nr:DnaJ-domain-containing protein [Zymoseptoria brevis]